MGIYAKNCISIRRVARAVALTVILLVAAVLCGCSDGVDIALTNTEITLAVGETRDIALYVTFSPATDNKHNIALESDSDGLKVSGTKITAVKPCNAKVTIKAAGKSKSLSVTVAHKKVNSLSIQADLPEQTVANSATPISVRLTAVTDEYADPELVPTWSVGEKTYSGKTLDFVPPACGEYEVAVTADGVTASTAVRVYSETEINVVAVGELNQTDVFDPVRFTAREQISSRNPLSVFRWSVNSVETGNGRVFDFLPPSAGSYEIALVANGKRVYAETVEAVGLNVPYGRVEFDANNVYVCWSEGAAVRYVSIIAPNGTRRNFDVTDAQYSHLFGESSLRVTEYIELCAEQPETYTIIIGADGRREFEFKQLPTAAERYIKERVLCENSYIADAAEAELWVRELYARGLTAGDCYVADGAVGIADTVNTTAAMLGMSAEIRTVGNVLSVEFDDYINAPTRHETSDATRLYSELPHIEYSEEKRRSNDYVFSLDRASRYVEVSGSEELLCAVVEGVRPVPKTNSVAAKIYRAAKIVLLGIIGADYTPQQKVHAVYDWLQWSTVNIVGYAAGDGSFLEGVFASSRGSGAGYAMTEVGMAKAFALLCGIEGIPCTVVVSDGAYYNRLVLDGLAYNTSVYRGKIRAAEFGISGSSEHTSHRGLLITDAELESLGITEESGNGAAFDRSASAYWEKHIYNGVITDNYLDSTEKTDAAVVKAAVYRAFDSAIIDSWHLPLPFVSGEVIQYNTTYGIELKMTGHNEPTASIEALIKKTAADYAAERFGPNVEFRRVTVRFADDIICVSAIAPITE